jgi:hypothetical protein
MCIVGMYNHVIKRAAFGRPLKFNTIDYGAR